MSAPNTEAIGIVYGVVRLTLSSGSYQWEFLPIPGSSYSDSGIGSCHWASFKRFIQFRRLRDSAQAERGSERIELPARGDSWRSVRRGRETHLDGFCHGSRDFGLNG